jgi:RNA polymerase sigma-70 factor (sigma-E family)
MINKIRRSGGTELTARASERWGVGAPMPDDEAFVRFVHAHADALFRTACLLTADSGDAEELLQNPLVRLHPHSHWAVGADVRVAYVQRALANAFVNAGRRASTRDVTVAEPPEGHVRDFADEIADRYLLWGLLRGLPERQRAGLVLRYFHDMSDHDIADALGCQAAIIRSLLSRGIGAMHSAGGAERRSGRRLSDHASGPQPDVARGAHPHQREKLDV